MPFDDVFQLAVSHWRLLQELCNPSMIFSSTRLERNRDEVLRAHDAGWGLADFSGHRLRDRFLGECVVRGNDLNQSSGDHKMFSVLRGPARLEKFINRRQRQYSAGRVLHEI